MKDLGSYKVPREAEVGRQVRFESRSAANRTAIFAIGGILVLCVCVCLGVGGILWATGTNPIGDIAFGLPLASAPEPTARPSGNRTPTLVPYGRAARSDRGLRVTVTTFQRQLPTEGVEIPDGQELVLVTVRIDNSRTTGAPLKYSPEDFALVTPDGENFAVNIGGITTGENLVAGEVAPGEDIKGDLIFFVYSDLPELQLAWSSADGKTRLMRLERE